MLTSLQVIISSPASDRQKVARLLHLYRRLDSATHRIQKKTGMRCQPDCGECCDNPNVEATVLELLPLAVDLWRRGKAQSWLTQFPENDYPPICAFYKKNLGPRALGCCGVYRLRPLVCRMFGFSATTDKHGRDELVTCGKMKAQSAAFVKACGLLQKGTLVPRMADYFRRAQMIDLGMTQYRLPINEALRIALERVGFLKTIRERVVRR